MIYDASKGVQERRAGDAVRVLSPIEEGGLSLRERQERALAFEWIPPSKMGRPPKYDGSWMPAQAYAWLCNRDVIFTQKMIATRFRVSVTTLIEWRNVYPDLAEAIAQGLAEQEGWLAAMMAGGIKYSQSVYAVLKNLHDWSDKIDQRTTVDLTEAIRRQSQAAERVQWDRALPSPLPQRKDGAHCAPLAQHSAPAPAQLPPPQPSASALPIIDAVHTEGSA